MDIYSGTKKIFSVETTDFRWAVEEAVRQGVDLRGASFYYCNLARAKLTNAKMRGACFYKTILTEADLTGADLTAADLQKANAADVVLTGANLANADLREANFVGADLRSANLKGANLREANFSRANLTDADLTDTIIKSTNFCQCQGVNPYLSTPLLMLLDQPGPIRAYKLVYSWGEGVFYGGINYLEDGDSFAVEMDPDPTHRQGAGIHLATLDWCMKHWEKLNRILIMEFNVKRADGTSNICVPYGSDGDFRVSECRRVDEVKIDEIF